MTSLTSCHCDTLTSSDSYFSLAQWRHSIQTSIRSVHLLKEYEECHELTSNTELDCQIAQAERMGLGSEVIVDRWGWEKCVGWWLPFEGVPGRAWACLLKERVCCRAAWRIWRDALHIFRSLPLLTYMQKRVTKSLCTWECGFPPVPPKALQWLDG